MKTTDWFNIKLGLVLLFFAPLLTAEQRLPYPNYWQMEWSCNVNVR